MKLINSFSMGKQNKRVIFLLSGWQNKLWMLRPFAAILARSGFYCITYAYEDDVFSPDTEKTVQTILSARDIILNKITYLKKEGYRDFSIFGTSLGSMIALLVANVTPDISHIILNTTGYDLAETVWSWNDGNQYFKKELQSQHFTLEKLQVVWAPINPVQNIYQIHNKKFLVFLSKKDEIIPYQHGEQLVKQLRDNGNVCLVRVNRTFGHILAGIYNLCNFPVYLKFLRS